MANIFKYTGRKAPMTVNLFFICCILFGQKEELLNNTGNIVNGGLVAYDSEHMYFTNLDSTVKGLYSIRLDGTELKRISEHQPTFMNISNGWIYFDDTYSNLKGIYRMKIDGSEEERLSSNDGKYINVIGEWLYYINWGKETNVCKMRIDGTMAQVVFPGRYQTLSGKGNWLYFKSIDSAGLYRGSLDTKKLDKLSSDEVWAPAVSGEYVYFRAEKKSNPICRVNNNGHNKSVIISDGHIYDRFIVFKDWVYLSDGQVFKRKQLNGNKIEIIFKGEIMEIGVSPNYVFYRSVNIDKEGNQYDKTIIKRIEN